MSCNCDDLPPKVDITEAEDECVTQFQRFRQAKCFSVIDGIINIFCSLKDVALAIREHADAVKEKSYASALIQFEVPEQEFDTDGESVSFEFSRSPFTYKVVGFGASWPVLPGPSTGVYPFDDSVQVKLWNFATNSQIGDTLVLGFTSSRFHDNDVRGGDVIGPNINLGEKYGVKLVYGSDDDGVFTCPPIHIYVHVEPVELITAI